MNHRPYPDVDRARHQLERGRAPEPPRCPVCTHFVNRHALEDGQPVCTRGRGRISCRDCAELWARVPAIAALTDLGRALANVKEHNVLVARSRRAGKTAITAAIADQAVKAGEHGHVAGRDGVRCAGGDEACTMPSSESQVCGFVHDQWVDGMYRERRRCIAPPGHSDGPLAYDHGPWQSVPEPSYCPGCGHAQHAPGTECESGVDHGPKRWHRCLCLATPGASQACPPQMDCQGGTLGYADIVHLRQGRTLRGANGETITPDVLTEPHDDAEVSDE